MKYDQLKDAFGSTPESVKDCVLRSLREEQRREPVMKRKMTVSMALALAAILLLGCVGLAATQLDGLADVFGFTNHETGETVVNEAAMKHITALNKVYEGKTVKFTLTEGLYSPLNEYISMGWTLEPLTEGEEYYILCNEKVGGSHLEAGSLTYVTEFFLDRPVSASRTGYLTGEGLETELKFSILKIKGEPVRLAEWDDEKETEEEFWQRVDALIADGKLPVAGDGIIEVRPIKDKTYSEELVIAGVAEITEEFTVSFDLGAISPVSEHRVYEGEKNFSFDGFELQISRVVVTPTDSRIEFDILCDQEITQQDMDASPYSVHFDAADADIWSKAINGTFSEPEKTADGRWKVSASYRAALQVVYPEELILSVVRYDENGEPIPLTGEGIPLKLTDGK